MTTLASLYIWIHVSLEAGWRPLKPRTWLTLLTVALAYIVKSMEDSVKQTQIDLTRPETRLLDSLEFMSSRSHVRAQDKLRRRCLGLRESDKEESISMLQDALRACIEGVEKQKVQAQERKQEKQRLLLP
ncbi:hypothetical protein B0A48_09668 [Cryoendolithus antarcticus]|uniref:Uncharacterized protein n=1 Tax=Cryoendolithus antarcticus TaxID=1507870 RepID=A0A1V8T003_9PEZI|nr:hypothetical protein B0A48_09668 [Cryoendolithus antarcticus]